MIQRESSLVRGSSIAKVRKMMHLSYLHKHQVCTAVSWGTVVVGEVGQRTSVVMRLTFSETTGMCTKSQI